MCTSALLRANGKPNGVQMIQTAMKGSKLRPGWGAARTDDGKLICILLILLSAPFCALVMITIGPPAVRLLLSIVHTVIH